MSRVYARFECRVPAELVTLKGSAPAEMLNVGMGGALVKARAGLLAETRARLRVRIEGSLFEILAEILQERGADPKDPRSALYALQFVDVHGARERVSRLVDEVRRLQR